MCAWYALSEDGFFQGERALEGIEVVVGGFGGGMRFVRGWGSGEGGWMACLGYVHSWARWWDGGDERGRCLGLCEEGRGVMGVGGLIREGMGRRGGCWRLDRFMEKGVVLLAGLAVGSVWEWGGWGGDWGKEWCSCDRLLGSVGGVALGGLGEGGGVLGAERWDGWRGRVVRRGRVDS